MAEKVIPNCINYADLKPEAIENEVRIVRYTPTSNINGAKPSDVVKFFLQGNGFFDPYSAYLKLTVTCNDVNNGLAATEVRTVDRSAHSFINRLVIRSQGVELERIEQYDVIAAMINDVIYSAEQQQLHSYEGFPTSQINEIDTFLGNFGADQAPSVTAADTQVAVDNALAQVVARNNVRISAYQAGVNIPRLRHVLGSTVVNGGSSTVRLVGEPCFMREQANSLHPNTSGPAYAFDVNLLTQGTINPAGDASAGQILPGSNFVVNGGHVPSISGTTFLPQMSYEFYIPIYSGIIGVLQPDKKLIPMNLMPLEVEFTLNPHALYSNLGNGGRQYQIDTFEIYAHTLFFEQEVHRALETIVAEQGLFMHMNSFTLAPITQLGLNVGGYAQINVPHKSINSLHTVFMYNTFDSRAQARKLNFCSHNITSWQIRNGSQLIPSEPITGTGGSNKFGKHGRFLIEMYKSWNKMFDPLSDGGINQHNFCLDVSMAGDTGLPNTSATDFDLQRFLQYTIRKQSGVGRCQYGISLEGEELGTDKSIITGRKAMLPFDINYTGSKTDQAVTSYMMTFVRSDAVLYLRPDLVVTVLGR